MFVESLEPRSFYGYKASARPSIGAVPAAIGNAIYDATGARVSHSHHHQGILMGSKG
jgi:CO/xanthine dehydrogenase Mo-binding subunit